MCRAVGVAVKPLDTRWRRKGAPSRPARVGRLRGRLQTETDPRIRSAIETQLRAFGRA